MINNCLFCSSPLKTGWLNHFLVNHNYSKAEIEKMFCLKDYSNVRKIQPFIKKPEVSYVTKEFYDFKSKFELETTFFFETKVEFQNRKHKKNQIKIINDYLILIEKKIKILKTNVHIYGGAEYKFSLYEIFLFEKLNEKLRNFYQSMIVEDTTNGYSWNSIEFDNESILIQYKTDRKIRLRCHNSLKILNELKDVYFSKKFPNYFIKVIVKNGKSKFEFFENKKIEDLLFLNANEINKEIVNHEIEKMKGCNVSKNKEEIKLQEIFNKNEFIKFAASLCTENDSIYPLIENNNQIYENSVLIEYYRSDSVFVLFENENIKRSGFLFCFKTYNREYLTIIKSFFESNSKNKRFGLYLNSSSLNSLFKTEMTLIRIYHHNLNHYSNKLKIINSL